jgi:hypothetical protein
MDHRHQTWEILQIRPPGYVHAEALTEFAECVYYGLKRLGLAVRYSDGIVGNGRLIVFGAHLLTQRAFAALPASAILYNSEQIDLSSAWLKQDYLTLLRTHEVWDYSADNVGRLQALGVEMPRHVTLGYVPELARIGSAKEEIDILFYGSVNERRRAILQSLQARGLKVVSLFGVYGAARDQYIRRAKLVLSMHFYDTKIFELVRAAYLLSNRKAVIAECGVATAIDADLRDAVCAVPYEGLVEACLEHLHDGVKRQQLSERGHLIFSRRREEDILAAALQLR